MGSYIERFFGTTHSLGDNSKFQMGHCVCVCMRVCVLCVHRVSDNEWINSREQIKWINRKALYYLNIYAI